jgi:hypothetical protein
MTYRTASQRKGAVTYSLFQSDFFSNFTPKMWHSVLKYDIIKGERWGFAAMR